MPEHNIPLTASTRFYFTTPDGDHTHKESIKLLQDAGFDGVDFALESLPYICSNDEELKRYCADVAEYAAKIGMQLTFGHLPFFGTLKVPRKDPRAPELLDRDIRICIRAAGYLGLERAVIHPLGNGAEENTPENIEKRRRQNIEFLGSFVEPAEKAGIKLAFENMRSPRENEGKHFYSAYPDELIDLCDTLGQEICWDFGHAHTTGLDMEESLKKLGKRLTVTHVNDNHGGEDEHLMPYFGTVDWEKVISGLRAVDYRYSFNLECKMFRVPDIAHFEAARYGCRISEYLTDRIFNKK
ncbi:MAG: sugar phosphate isomerase/epimerase [Clostridia bacterium]|nr:sugar phosphate isomerase/epimerase [Clostridia bacterium]